jgi:hypothetical protein
MTKPSMPPVASIASSSASADGGSVALAFIATDGETIELRLERAIAERLVQQLHTALAVDRPLSRRRYHDIKLGGLRGS